MEYWKNTLLTGAGFSHNFGTPLARGVWALIVGCRALASAPRVRELLLKEFNFEHVYHLVMDGDEFDEKDKAILADAVAAAYAHLDEIVRTWNGRSGSPYSLSLSGVRRLVESFAPSGHGVIFTLNQDLLIERHVPDRSPRLLGLNRIASISGGGRNKLEEHDYIDLPEFVDLRPWLQKGQFAYVKLHGSWNWRNPRKRPRRSMVLGGGKATQIANEPLLDAYYQLFREVLKSGGRRLVICGYGFADAHINEAIAEGVRDGGLRVCILSPQDPAEVRRVLSSSSEGELIWSGLEDYFPYTLRELFPENQEDTEAWFHLRKSIFD